MAPSKTANVCLEKSVEIKYEQQYGGTDEENQPGTLDSKLSSNLGAGNGLIDPNLHCTPRSVLSLQKTHFSQSFRLFWICKFPVEIMRELRVNETTSQSQWREIYFIFQSINVTMKAESLAKVRSADWLLFHYLLILFAFKSAIIHCKGVQLNGN